MSETATTYAFEQLEPSDPPPPPERIVAEASAEAEQIREIARADGYEQGRAAGHAEGLQEIRSATLALSEAQQGVESLRANVARAVEGDAIEFALALASKILQGALQARPELVVEVVQGAVRRISDRHKITVLVNPADLETVRSALGLLQTQGSATELCDVQSDRRVGVGGAIARTVEGEVDASVQTQLERAREVILAELEASESSP